MAALSSALVCASTHSLHTGEPAYLVPTYGRGWQLATESQATMSTAGYIVVEGKHGREYNGAGVLLKDAPLFK